MNRVVRITKFVTAMTLFWVSIINHSEWIRLTCVAFIAINLFVTPSSHANNRVEIIRGEVDEGIDVGSIGGFYLRPFCFFEKRTRISRKIYSVCQYGSECELTGLLDKHHNLVRIYSIRKIDTKLEPSSEVLLNASLWDSGVAEDVRAGRLEPFTLQILKLSRIGQKQKRTFVLYYALRCYENGDVKEVGAGVVRIFKYGDRWNFGK